MKERLIRRMALLLTVGAVLLAAGCGAGNKPVELMHVHGLGYTPDGTQLFVPAHDGFRIYQGGAWVTPETPRHDYMGFAATREGFYSSGHPAQGAQLTNPIGLVYSPDWGKSLTAVGFTGERDFHLLAAGYNSQVLFTYNPADHPQMARGLTLSDDKGKSWKAVPAKGVSGNLIQLAVHPDRAELLAVATDAGLFLSTDRGATFQMVQEGPVPGVGFHPNGKQLLFGLEQLVSYDLESGKAAPIASPKLDKDDYLLYIAVNPQQPAEIAVATVGRDLFLLQQESWKQIAADGKGR